MNECDNEQIHQINRHLFGMLGKSDLVFKWWESPNKYWKGETPATIYETSEEGKQEVYNYVMFHAYGAGG